MILSTRKLPTLVSLLILGLSAQAQPKLDLQTIFLEPYIYGVRPDVRGFSYDSKFLYVNWNDSSYSRRSLYEINLKNPKIEKASKDADPFMNVSPDGKRQVYTRSGDLWIADVDGKNEIRVTKTEDRESSPRWSPDGTAIAYQFGQDVWVYYLDGRFLQLTRSEKGDASFEPSHWVLDGRALVLRQQDRSDLKEVYFPEYNEKFVDPGASRRGVAKQRLSLFRLDTTDNRAIIEGVFWLRSTSVSADGRFLSTDIIDPDMKRREIQIYDLKSGDAFIALEDTTSGWINYSYVKSAFSSSQNTLVYSSETDGFNHLYAFALGKRQTTQLTDGAFEINWWNWRNSSEIIYSANPEDPGIYHAFKLDLGSGRSEQLTKQEAYRGDFSISPDGNTLVYLKSDWNTPGDLFKINLKKPRKEEQLTQTIPPRFAEFNLITPEYRRISSRDGSTKLSLTVLRDPEDEAPKPVVVFVHGAGSLQNVFKGWSNSYYREYLFNQWLVQQGFVVLEVDFRHSLGYGRKFREDVTGWMGRLELQDIEDGLAYIAEQGYADTSRVGIYGGSYGGFLSLYAVTHSGDRFDAAAALRAVTNWENYFYANPWYTQPRLGTPEKDKENYLRSSPLFHTHKMNKPVLILHGLEDNNVGFQDAVQYIEKLIQGRKEGFEMMMYPTERHSFQDPDAWLDEYKRIGAFFKKHLQD